MADDDQAWFDALAGRGGSGNETAAREGDQVRTALLRHAASEQDAMPAPDAAREAELLGRAAAAGLIAPTRVPRPRRFVPAWAFAAVACVAVGLVVLVVQQPAQIIERDAPDHVVRLQASDPVALKRELLQQLQRAGVAASGYERFEVQGIDAELPQPVPESVRAVLAQHGIDVPDDGVLRIEIAAP